jgi:multiple sugar transport system ATP-binding protein
MENGVTIAGVRKTFGAFEALRDINLSIPEGEFVVLVGPSGCGKSTLLRVIAGLEEATAGDVVIAGRNATNLTPRERNIAMVFQSYALYPHMNVAENMSFNLKLARFPAKEIERRIGDASRMLGLTDLLKRKPAQLSGGQRQRVAMGRAVVRDPSVFLFDEPLSNLDAKLRVQMRGEIKLLHQNVGKTTIYVTHDQIEALTLADRVVVMNQGRIEQQGKPMDLYNQPANLFVAGFIGSPAMNFLNAEVVHTGGGAAARLTGGMQFVLPDGCDVTEGQKIVLGLRPEHLGTGKGSEILEGAVRLVEPAGSQTFLVLDAADQTVMVVIDSEEVPTSLERYEARFDLRRMHIFDAKTEQRIGKRAVQ